MTVCALPSMADPGGYLQDARGTVVIGGFGNCWRTGTWTPDQAVLGCDGVLQPQVSKMTAPPVRVVVQPETAEPPPPPPPPPSRCDFSLTLAGAETFGFDHTSLTPAARQRLLSEVITPVFTCSKIEAVNVTGHADQLGTPQYNQALSEKRAQSVAGFLRSQGVSAPITENGAGASQPVVTCEGKMRQKQRIDCLAPNRRVTIEVRGIRTN